MAGRYGGCGWAGVECAVGYLFACLVRRARRVGGQESREVDRGLAAGMDRPYELVGATLGDDPAVQSAVREKVAAGRARRLGEDHPDTEMVRDALRAGEDER